MSRQVLACAVQRGDLSSIVGQRLRALRERDGVALDAVARAGQTVGLRWRRVTVAAIERGDRRLSIEELVLLPSLLARAGVGDGRHQLLRPDDRVQLAPRLEVSGSVLLAAMPGPNPAPIALPDDDDDDDVEWLDLGETESFPELTGEQVSRASRMSRGAAESRAAAVLGVTPLHVNLAAMATWGRSLSEERELRLAARTDLVGRDRHRAAGHVTRGLIRELRGVLEAKGVGDAGQEAR